MIRNRFLLILKFWHFANYEQDDSENRLYKIHNFVNKFNDNCHSLLKSGSKLFLNIMNYKVILIEIKNFC